MVLSRPLLIFVIAMLLILSIREWSDNFSQKPVTNKWAIIDGVVTLVPNSPVSNEKEKKAVVSVDSKQFDRE